MEQLRARLLAVCPSSMINGSANGKMPRTNYPFKRRQMPLSVEKDFTIVMELPEFEDLYCNDCGAGRKKDSSGIDDFIERVQILERDELTAALMVSAKDIFGPSLQDFIPCVGCRRSMEEMFKNMKDTFLLHSMEPLVITPYGELSLIPSAFYDYRLLSRILYPKGNRLNDMVDTLHKNKRNRRCQLHSLDNHKSKFLSNWIDVWDVMERPCREEVTILSTKDLKVTTDSYLSKHRFCSECKSKVLTAFRILIEEEDAPSDKDYRAVLFEGLRFCPVDKHVHILEDTEFIEKLVYRAEPDLSGMRRERHAKTLEAAQEEILTCVGLLIYNRLNHIWHRAKEQEQTWQLLSYVGMHKLQKAFEVALESKQGMTKIEVICEEINQVGQQKQLKREQKKQRKKARKKSKAEAKSKAANGSCREEIVGDHKCFDEEKENKPKCECPLETDENRNHPVKKTKALIKAGSGASGDPPDLKHQSDDSSGVDCGEDCNHSSREGSEVACSSDCCHDAAQVEDEVDPCQGLICADCYGLSSDLTDKTSPTNIRNGHSISFDENDQVKKICQCSNERQLRNALGWRMTLQDMLEDTHLSSDEESKLQPEEIEQFRANHKALDRTRAQLRHNLHQKFMHRVKLENPVGFLNVKNIINHMD